MLLKEKGHYVQPINYPTVPVGEEKIRLAPTPFHTREMIDKFVTDLLAVWKSLDLPLSGLTCAQVNILLFIILFHLILSQVQQALS